MIILFFFNVCLSAQFLGSETAANQEQKGVNAVLLGDPSQHSTHLSHVFLTLCSPNVFHRRFDSVFWRRWLFSGHIFLQLTFVRCLMLGRQCAENLTQLVWGKHTQTGNVQQKSRPIAGLICDEYVATALRQRGVVHTPGLLPVSHYQPPLGVLVSDKLSISVNLARYFFLHTKAFMN